jgi:L-threonylcarbamoyladenylate synthase
VGVESTVQDKSGSAPRLLRPGGTPKEAIEALIGPVCSSAAGDDSADEVAADTVAANGTGGLVSPGQLKSHYAPKNPLEVFPLEKMFALTAESSTAWLFFDGSSREAWLAAQGDAAALKPAAVRVLSESGDTLEAAACLFQTLHELDSPAFSRIFVQFAPEQGLGAAINDRLRRAAIQVRHLPHSEMPPDSAFAFPGK